MATDSNQQNDRVREATPSSLNAKIERDTWQRVASYYGKSEAEISSRINELNKEWDIERYLGVNMSTLAISGLAAGAFSKNRNWLIMPAVVLAFFFQHSVQGWCPPLPLFRKLKVRTRKEIEQEKYALKVLRGDFKGVYDDVQSSNFSNLKEVIQKNNL